MLFSHMTCISVIKRFYKSSLDVDIIFEKILKCVRYIVDILVICNKKPFGLKNNFLSTSKKVWYILAVRRRM